MPARRSWPWQAHHLSRLSAPSSSVSSFLALAESIPRGVVLADLPNALWGVFAGIANGDERLARGVHHDRRRRLLAKEAAAGAKGRQLEETQAALRRISPAGKDHQDRDRCCEPAPEPRELPQRAHWRPPAPRRWPWPRPRR